MPSNFADLTDRLDALEERQLRLSDLPIAALQRKLESDWQPSASTLLGEGSVTLDMLAGIARGSDSVVWPGGSPESSALTVNHSVGAVPNVQVTASSRVGAVPIIIWTGSITATSFDVRARTVDGSSPAAAATATFDWRAEG